MKFGQNVLQNAKKQAILSEKVYGVQFETT